MGVLRTRPLPPPPLIEVETSLVSDIATSTPSVGLGDTIAKITHATGLDQLAQMYTAITGQPCGCAQRQEALNKLFPYGVKEDGV